MKRLDEKNIITKLLKFEEGYSETAYKDTLGFPTIGIGKKIGPKNADLKQYIFTVPLNVAYEWLKQDLKKIKAEIMSNQNTAKAFAMANQPRKDIFIMMAYQMGVEGLSEFDKTLRYAAAGEFVKASFEMLDSLWAKETKSRAKRESEVMKLGSYTPYKAHIAALSTY